MCSTMRGELLIVLSSLLVWFSEGATQSMPGRLCVDEDDGSAPHCYYAFYDQVTQADAIANCASFGGSLVLPKHFDENYDLAEFMAVNGLQRSWIDAVETPLTWPEVTGNLQPWAPGKPDSNEAYSACVTLPHAEDFKWDHDECTSKHGFVCERDGTAADCQANNQFMIADSCYTYNWDAQVTWFEASTACEEIDSYLSVMQDSEAFFLSVQLLSKSLTATFWVGHTNRIWKDSNSNRLQFFNWDAGQPDQNVQKCGVLLDNGYWMDRNCTFKFPYICEKGCASGIRGTPTCIEKEDGDYQSCTACDAYNSCSGGAISENRECGHPGQIWDDNNKRCDLTSDTCDLPIDVFTTEAPTPLPTEKQTDSGSGGSSTLLIGLGVSAAVLIILAVAIGMGVYYTRRKHPESSSSVDGRRKLTDDDLSVISNESPPDFARATKYSHETFLDSDAGNGEQYWTWRNVAGPKNSHV